LTGKSRLHILNKVRENSVVAIALWSQLGLRCYDFRPIFRLPNFFPQLHELYIRTFFTAFFTHKKIKTTLADTTEIDVGAGDGQWLLSDLEVTQIVPLECDENR
jgi:hypothetical protein